MKPNNLLFVLAICLPAFCSSQTWADKINVLTKELAAHTSLSLYDSLHFILTDHYSELTTAEKNSIRNTIEKQAAWSTTKLCSDKELGTKITIKGRILDEHKKPIANVHIYVYHADNNGNYAPNDGILKKMSEGDPRLFGFIMTDILGNYAFETVRPASYPNKYNGRTIPQHIHINVTANGFKTRAVQMAFDNDPQMKDIYWRNWAKEQNYPVVKLQQGKSRQLVGVWDLIMNP